MPSIRITVTGLDEVKNGINRFLSESANIKRDVLTQATDFMVSELRRNAHVITGYMKNSIKSQFITDSQTLVEVGANYAVYENARPGFKVGSGPHNFADRAEQATRDRFGSIIASTYGSFFSSL